MFAGLTAFSESPAPGSWVDAARWRQRLYPFTQPDLFGHWSAGQAQLVAGERFNAPWSRHARAVPLVDDRLAVAFWGRLDNRLALARQLAIDTDRLKTFADSQLVLAAWRRWGEALPRQLEGDFALAVIDADQRRLLLARDPVGVKPLYYWPSPRGLLFATAVAGLQGLDGLDATPDSDWMARYLVRMSMCRERTGYREILKIPPGHALTLHGDEPPRLQSWHAWRDDAPTAKRRAPEWLEAYREALAEAVRRRMHSDYPLASENSGGIDSASVTAWLAKLLDEPGERLFSFGFAVQEQEAGHILATSRATGIRHNHLISNRQLSDQEAAERIQRGLRVLGYPQEHPSAGTFSPLYQIAQLHGIRSQFSGFGGDEAVTNSGYLLRRELVDSGNLAQLLEILPGSIGLRLLRLPKAVWRERQRQTHSPAMLKTWRQYQAQWVLRPDLVEKLGLRQAYLARAEANAAYRRLNAWVIEGQLSLPHIPVRLENGTLLAASYGIDYCWPLLDARLIQQYLSTPSIEKFGPGGIGRYLHRRAIDGLVPRSVAWKRTKTMGSGVDEGSGLARIARRAQRTEQSLHPALDELIDRERWRTQIALAAQGRVPRAAQPEFRRTAAGLEWLSAWLGD